MPKDEQPVRRLTRDEQIALAHAITLRTRAKQAKTYPPYVSNVERDEDNATFYITFTESLSTRKQEGMVDWIMNDHRDYVVHAQWTTTGKLLVRLRKPRRDVAPDSRRGARCDIPKIASGIFARLR